VDPVTVSIVIDAPREEIFDFLQDVANHPQFTDHFLVDWHLTREGSVGAGAGARFRVKAPANRFSWGELALTEVTRPHRLVELGRTGKANRIRTRGIYELSPAASGTTRVSFTFETMPALLSDRTREALGMRWWTRRQYARALRRLRAILESRERPPVRLPGGMRSTRNPALLVASAVLAVLALSACGSANDKTHEGTYAGEGGVAAPYLTVGPLIYQVQISRQLNPFDEEDSEYLAGLTPAQAKLSFGEEWFGVFIQVHNDGTHPALAATAMTVSDFLGHRYTPVIPLGRNPYIYLGGLVPGAGTIPGPNSTAAFGPTQGALLLYKIKNYSLENRPLTLRIISSANPAAQAAAELDV
jgi:uncharacterized protein YndB with AHSA1/START domain